MNIKTNEYVNKLATFPTTYFTLNSLMFQNSFQSKSFFIVHPEWLSEVVDNTDPDPLQRPPWPWEQPKYRQNIKLHQLNAEVAKAEEEASAKAKEEKLKEEAETHELQYLPYADPIGYTFTHPGLDKTKPFEKQTRFGAPVVDTSQFRG